MLNFTPNGSISSNTVISKVKFLQGGVDKYTLEPPVGSVEDDGVNSYVVIDFELGAQASAFSVDKISLIRADDSEIASCQAPTGKYFFSASTSGGIRVRLGAKFAGAQNCVLSTTATSMPYATSSRDGVVRLYNTDIDGSDKSRVVYTAEQVDDKIASSQSESGFIPWSGDTGVAKFTTVNVVDNYETPTKTVAITTTSDGKLNINSTVTGNAVSSSPTISSGAITTSEKLVNEAYISSLYTNSVTENSTGLVTSGAVYNYISTNTATAITDGDNKLVTADLVHDYIDGLDSNYVHVTGNETVAGSKTFSDALIASTSVSSPLYIGDGVLSGINAADWIAANNAKLPTVQATMAYVGKVDSDIRYAFEDADSDLQSQIDALNAGQNLADMVSTKAALDALDTTNLAVGDKVQVLTDETQASASTVYNLTSKDPKTWTYIGKYGQDSYTKAEADDKFMLKDADFDTTYLKITDAESTYLTITNAQSTYIPLTAKDEAIAATESNDTVPTSLAVYTYVSGEVSTLNTAINGCLKSDQLVTSISGSSTDEQIPTAKAVSELLTTSATNYAKLDGGNTFTGATNTFNAISATTVTASGAVTGASLSAGTGEVTGGSITASVSVESPSVSSQSYTGDGVLATYDGDSWTDESAKITTVKTTKVAIETQVPNLLVGMSGSLSGDASNVKIGTIGLFMLSNSTGLDIGATVNGTDLQPAGITLTTNGKITYTKQVKPMAGTWTLLSYAPRISGSTKALVLAMRTA